MYATILALHNLVRWVIIITGLLAIGSAIWGVLQRRDWTKTDRLIGMFFSIALDVQLVLGGLLYFVYSPLTRIAFQDFSAAMGESNLRFFSLEHALYMALAVVLVHVGSISSRKASTSMQQHRRALLWFLLAGLMIALGMPWARPWWPF